MFIKYCIPSCSIKIFTGSNDVAMMIIDDLFNRSYYSHNFCLNVIVPGVSTVQYSQNHIVSMLLVDIKIMKLWTYSKTNPRTETQQLPLSTLRNI